MLYFGVQVMLWGSMAFWCSGYAMVFHGILEFRLCYASMVFYGILVFRHILSVRVDLDCEVALVG